MIALPQRLPHVLWNTERPIPLSEAWLVESIRQSARQAGYLDWHLTRHVARAVLHYLENDTQATTLTVPALEAMVRKALESVGFADVAHKSVILPPRVSIFLPEIARKTGYELLFFPALKNRLQEAFSLRVRGVQLEGLRPCSKILTAKRRWESQCQEVSQNIIGFSQNLVKQWPQESVELLIC